MRGENEKWYLSGTTFSVMVECVEGDWFVILASALELSFIPTGTKNLEVAMIRALEIVRNAYQKRISEDVARVSELDDLSEFERNCQLYEAP